MSACLSISRRTPKDEEFFDAIKYDGAGHLSRRGLWPHSAEAAIIDLPKMGTLNIHASLLPVLRGAAPIQAAIRQGLTETGVTIMRMVPALDAGPIILPAADADTRRRDLRRAAEPPVRARRLDLARGARADGAWRNRRTGAGRCKGDVCAKGYAGRRAGRLETNAPEKSPVLFALMIRNLELSRLSAVPR